MPQSTVRQFVGIVLLSIVNYIVLVILFALYYVVDKYVTPFHQRFSLNNYTIQYPHAEHERLTFRQTVYVTFLIPALIILFYTIIIDGFLFSGRKIPRHSLFTPRDRRSQKQIQAQLWELNCAWLGLGLAQGVAFLSTAILKRMAGKPRPDLIARCQPKAGSVDRPVYGLSDISICTQTHKHTLQDGFMSWPSGHSSASFAGLTFLSIYLYHKLHPSHSRTSIFPHQNWRILISLVPLLGAILIAVTRIMDARHHPFDVLSGSFLGIMTAILGWRQYFPISWEDCADQSDGNLFLPITQQDDVDQGLEDSGAVD